MGMKSNDYSEIKNYFNIRSQLSTDVIGADEKIKVDYIMKRLKEIEHLNYHFSIAQRQRQI